MSDETIAWYVSLKVYGGAVGIGIVATFIVGVSAYAIVVVVREKLRSNRRWRDATREDRDG